MNNQLEFRYLIHCGETHEDLNFSLTYISPSGEYGEMRFTIDGNINQYIFNSQEFERFSNKDKNSIIQCINDSVKDAKEYDYIHRPLPDLVEGNLELIQITHGTNGYPKWLEYGIIGFESYEEAEEFASQWDCEVCSFHRRDGWQLWECKGNMYEEYELDATDFGGDNVFELDGTEDSKRWVEEDFAEWVKSCNPTEEQIEDMRTRVEDVLQGIELCDENQFLVVDCGYYGYEIQDRRAMNYSYDTHQYVIGVKRNDVN